MKKYFLLTFILFSSINAFAENANLVRLFFSYSWLYDGQLCPATESNPRAIDPKWVLEIEERAENFSKIWLEKSPILFKTLFDRTGLGFSRKEMTATFSVCPKKMSYSDPLVLNMTRFLDSYPTHPNPDKTEEGFVDLVFHELLHTWVDENLKNSILLKKYKDENASVRNHLHLMAIQQFVYLKLGRPDMVSKVEKNYKIIGGTYARSWEIVQIEGYLTFMNEFQFNSDRCRQTSAINSKHIDINYNDRCWIISNYIKLKHSH